MRAILVLTLLMFVGAAHASSTRVLGADQLTTSTNILFTLPNGAAANLMSTTSTDSVSNKMISGASNTLSLLPVATQVQQDVFSGNGSTTVFTLSVTAGTPNVNGMTVYVDGLLAEPGGSDYTYSAGSASITFVTAPAAGQSIRAIYHKY